MWNSSETRITKLAEVFLEPSNATHRQYEALRAYFVDGLPSSEAAQRFGYTPGSFRVLCHQFRQNPKRQFFIAPAKGPGPAPKRKDNVRDQIIALRKQNLSIYDISRSLENLGHQRSPTAIAKILKEEGFARLPRRRDEELINHTRPTKADVADARQLDLGPRRFRTKFGGLFLFLPQLARIPLDRILDQAGFPGTRMIPAGCAMRSLLGLKLFGNARHSHVGAWESRLASRRISSQLRAYHGPVPESSQHVPSRLQSTPKARCPGYRRLARRSRSGSGPGARRDFDPSAPLRNRRLATRLTPGYNPSHHGRSDA